jgi:hypothetical protein
MLTPRMGKMLPEKQQLMTKLSMNLAILRKCWWNSCLVLKLASKFVASEGSRQWRL